MNTYTAFEYLMIATANAFGEDKSLFEDRIEWVKSNGKILTKLADKADDKAMFIRCVLEIQRVLKGQPTNLPIGLDATASGLQMLAIMSGCKITANNVGLVDPNRRCDAYTTCVHVMNEYLNPNGKFPERAIGFNPDGLTRDDVKGAFMPHFYYSRQEPLNIFGKGTAEHLAFMKSTDVIAPGANMLMEDIHGAMLECDKSVTTEYKWTLPDRHTAFTRVFTTDDYKFELEELKNENGNNSTFTHRMQRNVPNVKDVSLVANVTHSVDGFVVREMQGRMNYDVGNLLKVKEIAQGCRITDRTKMISIYEVDHILASKTMDEYDDNTLGLVAWKIEQVLENPRAPMYSVHDEFKTLAPYCNQMRQYYINICAEMSESTMMQDILRQLYRDPLLNYNKCGNGDELAQLIRGSNYAIC